MPVNMKRMLSRELFSLIEEKGIDKINVQMLASRCGISRQAFYYHFKDIKDVIEWACQEALKDLTQQAVHVFDPADILQLYLDMAVSSQLFLMRICESVHYHALEQLLCKSTEQFLAHVLSARWPDTYSDLSMQHLFLSFYSSALVLHTLKLIQLPHPDTKKDAQQLAHLFFRDF